METAAPKQNIENAWHRVSCETDSPSHSNRNNNEKECHNCSPSDGRRSSNQCSDATDEQSSVASLSSFSTLDVQETFTESTSSECHRKRKRNTVADQQNHTAMSVFSSEIQNRAFSVNRKSDFMASPPLKKPHHRRWRGGEDVSSMWNSTLGSKHNVFTVQNLPPPPPPAIFAKKQVHWSLQEEVGDHRDDHSDESSGPPPPPPPLSFRESTKAQPFQHYPQSWPTSFRGGGGGGDSRDEVASTQQHGSKGTQRSDVVTREYVDQDNNQHAMITTTTKMHAPRDKSRRKKPQDNKGELAESQFQLQELIGQGHFGKIHRATMAHNTSSKSLVLKRFSKVNLVKASRRGGRLVELVKREIGIHRRLDHEHIVTYYGHVYGPTHLSIVLEYAPHGDLFGYMGRIPSSLERLKVARQVMRQLSIAVDYLGRSRSIAHRDIKPENILVFGDLNPNTGSPVFKIADFGWAVRFSSSSRQTTLCGTPEYVPVEMLQTNTASGQLSYDAQYVDLWALGVLMYELLHGFTPFFVEDEEEGAKLEKAVHTHLIYQNVRKFKGAQYLPMDCVTVDCFHLMDSLLQIDPKRRCSAYDVANHAFLNDLYMP